jgi:hypothetical protein
VERSILKAAAKMEKDKTQGLKANNEVKEGARVEISHTYLAQNRLSNGYEG